MNKDHEKEGEEKEVEEEKRRQRQDNKQIKQLFIYKK